MGKPRQSAAGKVRGKDADSVETTVVNAHSRTPARLHNEQREQFLERFSECGSVLQACNDTGVARRTHYEWLAADPEYKAAFEVAKQQAVDALEARVFQRANVESDRLAEFLLKGLRPQIYGDRFKAEHSGPDGKPMETETTLRITFDGK
jgi:hypothetical protein